MSERKKIVILGGGFGGLRAALVLARELQNNELENFYELVLVDRNEHHMYTPLLYEIATTSKDTADMVKLHTLATYDYRKILAGRPAAFLQDEVVGIAREEVKTRIRLKRTGTLEADYAIIALGSEVNDFGIPGLRENALTLKTFVDALRVRDAVFDALCDEKRAFDIILGGGGATGVELAGEFKSWEGQLRKTVRDCHLNVTVVEVRPAVLSGFDPRIIKAATARLAKLGVSLVTGRRVVSVAADCVKLDGGQCLKCDLFIWTGGVKPSSLVDPLPFLKNRGRLAVTSRMQCLTADNNPAIVPGLYALGDAIYIAHPATGKPAPQVAHAAILEAEVAAKNIFEDIKVSEGKSKKPRGATFVPGEYSYITPIGGKYAVSKVGPFVFKGFFAWLLKGLVEFKYLLSVMPPGRATRVWLRGFFIFMANDRLG